MEKLTLEKLIEDNLGYYQPYEGVKANIEDLNIAQKVIRAKEKINQFKTPLEGDIVEFQPSYGKFCTNGIIDIASDFYNKDIMHICVNPEPYPFLYECNRISTSGGPYERMNKKDFCYAGTRETYFQTWGRFGSNAYGAIRFPVTVNVWKQIKK